MEGIDAELNVGPGMPPKVQESLRRKSVSHKDKQVVTIGMSCLPMISADIRRLYVINGLVSGSPSFPRVLSSQWN